MKKPPNKGSVTKNIEKLFRESQFEESKTSS
jgi:hypothetical protein